MKNIKGQCRASVIIPTRGRDSCVRQTLRDLRAQTFSDFEIWLVDQNEIPLLGLAEEVGGKEFFHEIMPPLGSHAGRNHAIFRANGPICIFVDDDVRVQTDFVARHVKALEEASSDVGAIAGRVIQPRDGYTENQMRRLGRPARYNSWLGLVSGNFIGEEQTYVQHIHECNFSVRTDLLRQVGGFNVAFKGNAYFEGADLALRFLETGSKILYHPEISLVHLQEAAGGNRVQEKARHTYWYMRNYGLLNSLHMKRVGFPAFGLYGLYYVFGKAMKNRNLKIATQGLRGFVDGLKYFLK